MDYKKALLNKLLEKYEKSKIFSGKSKVERRIKIDFTKKEFPHYDLENVEAKENIHYALKELEGEGVIEIKWAKFEEGNIVEKVFLNTQNLEKAYEIAKREPKESILNRMAEKLLNLKKDVRGIWLSDFIDYELENIKAKNYPSYLPKEEDLFELTLKALKGIDEKGDEELLERVFSKRYLKGSKEFEKVRGKVFAVLKEFFLKEDVEEKEAFEKIGIVKTIEEILFFGSLKVSLKGNILDFSLFPFGASLNSLSIKELQIIDLSCEKIITVENKANFYYLIKDADLKNDFILYLGGFYSPSKRLFLEKLYEFIKEKNKPVKIFHWGDIDLGGFKIFLKLKEIIPDLIPLYMDRETLIKYKDLGEPLEKVYEEKLRNLLEKQDFKEFHDVIKEMLKLGIRLEQEAVIS